MKFKVNSKELKSRLENLQKVRRTKTVIPILSYFKVEVTEENVLMTSSDKEVTLIAKMIPEEIKTTGVICVLADQFVEIVRKFSDVSLEIYLEGKKLVIKSNGGKFKIPCVDADDFPELIFNEPEGEVQIPAPIFIEGINKTIFCAKKIEMEPIWDNVSIKTSEDRIEFAATDKQRIGIYRSTFDINNNASVIIPSKLASMLQSVTTKDDIYVNLSYDDKRIMVDLNDYTVYCLASDGKYVDYNTLLNQSTDCSFSVGTQQLKEAVERSLVFANTQMMIGLSTLIGAVSVSAENTDWSLESEEEIVADNNDGSGQILVNGRMLIDILNNVNTEKVEFSFSAATPMVYVNPVGTDQDYLYSLGKYKSMR